MPIWDKNLSSTGKVEQSKLVVFISFCVLFLVGWEGSWQFLDHLRQKSVLINLLGLKAKLSESEDEQAMVMIMNGWKHWVGWMIGFTEAVMTSSPPSTQIGAHQYPRRNSMNEYLIQACDRVFNPISTGSQCMPLNPRPKRSTRKNSFFVVVFAYLSHAI